MGCTIMHTYYDDDFYGDNLRFKGTFRGETVFFFLVSLRITTTVGLARPMSSRISSVSECDNITILYYISISL